MEEVEKELIAEIERARYRKAIFIKPEDIQVEDRVKLACRSCYWYKKRYSCPPYSWNIEKTKEIIKYFNRGIMVVWKVTDVPLRIVRYEPIGFIAGACPRHLICAAVLKRPCFSPHLRRSSLESVGINVHKLAERYEIKGYQRNPKNHFHWIGLVLYNDGK